MPEPINIEASFVTSAPTIQQAPPADMAEVAFMGRSNVGKSSLLNTLTNRKSLAKSSSTPGKTRLINFFDVTFLREEFRGKCRFVDLPGFGYAKVSKEMKKDWERHLTGFITGRSSIRVFVHLIDSRHPEQEIDIEVREYLQHILRPDQIVLEVFTKTDKLNSSELGKLKNRFPGGIYVSNLKKSGVEKLRQAIFTHLYGENPHG